MTRNQLAMAIFALVCLCPIGAGAGDDLPRMQRAIDLRVVHGQFMGAILVAREGRPIFDRAFGSADLDWNIANSTATKFRIGSLTKQFTAASILLLEERGKLKIDDPIGHYLPDVPPSWQAITIFELLNHTSGIPNFTDFPDYAATQGLPTSPEQLVARFRDKPLDFAPGSRFSYSNSGYVLLGYLIEKLTGESYARFVRENLFAPLGMKDSGYDFNSEVVPRRAVGYVPGPKGPLVADHIDMSVPFSAGGLYSTTGDLLRWEEGLFGGKLLAPASLKKMTTPTQNHYGLGVIITTSPGGAEVVWHNGGIDGFNSGLAYVPAKRVAVIVLANLNGAAADSLTRELLEVALGDPVTLLSDRKAVPLAGTILDRMAGYYQLPDGKVVAVSREGDHLQIDGASESGEIRAENDHTFFAELSDDVFSFENGPDGKVSALVMRHEGQPMRALRLAEDQGRHDVKDQANPVQNVAAVQSVVTTRGTETALRRSLEALARGAPEYERMTPALSALVRQQAPSLAPVVAAWGPIQSLEYKGVTPKGADIYAVHFAHASVEVHIALDADGRISAERILPLAP
jgi:CubicO group peptidase (beta-lactamase class C family)